MASLVKWLYFSGAMDGTSLPVSSGKAYFWVPNSTSAPATIYADAAESQPLTHPITLDAAGRAEVYVVADCEIVIKDVSGAQERLSVSAEGTKAGPFYGTFQGTPNTLDSILLNIGTQLTNLTATPTPDTRVVTTVPTASPVFTFNENFRVNVFKATYATAMGNITVNWPTSPTLVKATRYRFFVQMGSGTATQVLFPAQITHSWGAVGSPSTLAANTYYTAEFMVNEAETGLYQTTSWWVYGGSMW